MIGGDANDFDNDDDEDEDEDNMDPEKKIKREKVRRQQNNARER